MIRGLKEIGTKIENVHSDLHTPIGQVAGVGGKIVLLLYYLTMEGATNPRGLSWMEKVPLEILSHILSFVHGLETFYLSKTCPILRKRLLNASVFRNHHQILKFSCPPTHKFSVNLPLGSIAITGLEPAAQRLFTLEILPPTIEHLVMKFPMVYYKFVLQDRKNIGLSSSLDSYSPNAEPQFVNFNSILPNLLSLTCKGNNGLEIAHKSLPHLPPSLTLLSLDAINVPDYAPCYGPTTPNLRYLVLKKSELIRKTLLSNCAALETLHLSDLAVCLIPQLPTSLTKLNIHLDDNADLSELSTLKETQIEDLCLVAAYSTVLTVCRHCPPNLTQLKIITDEFHSTMLPLLPKSVRRLIFDPFMLGESWCWDGLPSSITAMELLVMSYQTPRGSADARRLLTGLPSHVKDLKLFSIPFLSSSIPPGLDCITQVSVDLDDNDNLVHLSRSLKSLTIHLLSPGLPTQPWILPSTLSSLTVIASKHPHSYSGLKEWVLSCLSFPYIETLPAHNVGLRFHH